MLTPSPMRRESDLRQGSSILTPSKRISISICLERKIIFLERDSTKVSKKSTGLLPKPKLTDSRPTLEKSKEFPTIMFKII